MNRYETTFNVICPNDNDNIEYTLVLETDDEMTLVEDINRASWGKGAFRQQPGRLSRALFAADIEQSNFHESIADRIYELLGGKQTITAVHQGVKITTVRGELTSRVALKDAIKNAYFKYGHSDWQAVADQVIEEMK